MTETITNDRDPARDAAFERLLTLGADYDLIEMFKQVDWAMGAGIVQPDDVPTPLALADITQWMDSTGITAAWETMCRPALPCPSWCAGEHGDRIGPDGCVVHRRAMGQVTASYSGNPPTPHDMTLEIGESYDDAGPPTSGVLYVDDVDLSFPDSESLRQFASALAETAKRWAFIEDHR